MSRRWPVGKCLLILRGSIANYEECPLSETELKFTFKKRLLRDLRYIESSLGHYRRRTLKVKPLIGEQIKRVLEKELYEAKGVYYHD